MTLRKFSRDKPRALSSRALAKLALAPQRLKRWYSGLPEDHRPIVWMVGGTVSFVLLFLAIAVVEGDGSPTPVSTPSTPYTYTSQTAASSPSIAPSTPDNATFTPAPTPVPTPVPTPAPTSVAQGNAAAMQTWYSLFGSQFNSTNKIIANSLEAEVEDGLEDNTSDWKSECQLIGVGAATLQTMESPAPGDATLTGHFTSGVNYLTAGAQDCITGLNESNYTLLTQSSNELLDGVAQIDDFKSELKA